MVITETIIIRINGKNITVDSNEESNKGVYWCQVSNGIESQLHVSIERHDHKQNYIIHKKTQLKVNISEAESVVKPLLKWFYMNPNVAALFYHFGRFNFIFKKVAPIN